MLQERRRESHQWTPPDFERTRLRVELRKDLLYQSYVTFNELLQNKHLSALDRNQLQSVVCEASCERLDKLITHERLDSQDENGLHGGCEGSLCVCLQLQPLSWSQIWGHIQIFQARLISWQSESEIPPTGLLCPSSLPLTSPVHTFVLNNATRFPASF